MGINFERKPPFCNNITCTTKVKTLSSYSEDNQNIIITRNEILYKLLSIDILHSVINKDNEHCPRAYMEEYKYERIEKVHYFNNDLDSDSDSDSDSYSDFEQ